ncbi:hypothetical protein FGF66_01485 [Chlorobaculum thiosulfatiphilum]|uniref:Uncharacterized protein n=1 Tax=Chlorobaculum thiosulfatiphilum TaxID=115852 RepID=A0A5C4SA14_CHLTI|nr:hypothetical protein FGF66_01485 [Chlorobaculum thiosulfatiphilum]
MKTKINYVTKRRDNRYGKSGKTLHEFPIPTRPVVYRVSYDGKSANKKSSDGTRPVTAFENRLNGLLIWQTSIQLLW